MSIPGLPEAFACDRCGRPNLLGDIQPGESVTCVACGHVHNATPEFIQTLQSRVNARTLADVQAAFSAPMATAPTASAAPTGPTGPTAPTGPPPDNPKLGLRGRSAGALSAPARGNMLTPLTPAQPAQLPPTQIPEPQAPSWDAPPPPPPPGPPASWDAPPQPVASWDAPPPPGPPAWDGPDDRIATSDAQNAPPPWAISGMPGPPIGDAFPPMPAETQDAVPAGPGGVPAGRGVPGNNEPWAAALPPMPSGGPQAGAAPWAGALPPMPRGAAGAAPKASTPVARPEFGSVAADLPRRDPTIWKSKLLRSETEIAEAAGKKFALWTAGAYSGCVALIMLALAITGATATPGSTAAAAAAYLAIDRMLPLLGIGIGGVCAAIWAPTGLIRGWICLSLGMAPLVFVVFGLLSSPVSVPFPVVTAVLLVPALMMFVYGGSAAMGQCIGSDWLRERTAGAALTLVGLLLWVFVNAHGSMDSLGMMMMSMPFIIAAAILCVPPVMAIYNYFLNNQRMANLVPLAFWVVYLGPISFLVFANASIPNSSGLLLFLMLLATFGTMFGWMFVGGAGFRDLLVYADLQGRAKKANVQLDVSQPAQFARASPMSPDGGYHNQPESGEPFSG